MERQASMATKQIQKEARAALREQAAAERRKHDATTDEGVVVDLLQSLLKMDNVAKMQMAFNEIDTDRSGFISTDELDFFLRRTFPDAPDSMIAQYKATLLKECSVGDQIDMDSFIKSEFRSLFTGPVFQSEDALKDALADIFNEIDLDGNGTLDHYELVLLLQKIFPNASESERRSYFDEILKEADADGDGQISMQEFMESKYRFILGAQKDVTVGVNKPATKAPLGFKRKTKSVFESSCLASVRSRCKEHSPLLLSGVLPDGGSPGADAFRHAEITLRSNHIGPIWQDAMHAFAEAGNVLLAESKFTAAGDAYIRSSDCHRCLHDKDGEAQMLVKASDAYQKAPALNDAINAIEEAVTIFEEIGNVSRAAKHARTLAELYVDVGDADAAINTYTTGGRFFRDKQQLRDARACLMRCVEICVGLERYPEAIAYLEEMYEYVVDKPIVLFYAMLCQVVDIPPDFSVDHEEALEHAKNAFNEYTDVCPEFQKGSERNLVYSILRFTQSAEYDRLEEALGKYSISHTLPPWVVVIMRKILNNVWERKLSVEKIWTI